MTTTVQIDVSRITNIAEREKAARLFKAAVAAEAAFEAARETFDEAKEAEIAEIRRVTTVKLSQARDELKKVTDSANAAFRKVRDAAYAEESAAFDALYAADPALAALRAASVAADDAYSEHPLTVETTSGDDMDFDVPELCALTGIPIVDTDETIEDEASGRHILRAVLPLPAAGEESKVGEEQGQQASGSRQQEAVS